MKVKFTAYVHKYKYGTAEDPYVVWSGPLENYGDILLDTVEVEIEFTLPSDREILERAVANLKAEKAKIEADVYVMAQEIQGKIDKLLCIEHKPGGWEA